MTAKPPAGSEQASDAFAQAHARLLADRSIQFELREIEVQPPRPEWNSGFFDFLNSQAVTVLFWILVALAVLFILYRLARRFLERERAGGEVGAGDEAEALRPRPSLAPQLLDEADRLAAQGRFGEAAHLLLFRGVEDIESRRPGLLRPALTSRDIASHPDLPERVRLAFSAIARSVEISLFGRRDLAAEDWAACRSAYERFAFAEGWQ